MKETRADRAHERHARQRQRGGGRNHRNDVRIVLEIMGQRGDDDLGVATIAVGEQRADRAIDQAGDQGLALGRAAFALEVAAGNAAGRVGLFLVVAGQRQEVDAFLRLLRRHHGREHDGLAVGRNHCAIGLARNLAGFEFEGASAPIEFDGMYIEHSYVFHWFVVGRRAKNQKAMPRWRDAACK